MISYQMGYKGVDSTPRQVPEDPGDSWTEMAEHILRGMAAAVTLIMRRGSIAALRLTTPQPFR